MKPAKFLALALLGALVFFGALELTAADNDQAAPKYRTDASANQVKVRTTDTAGVHTPHVIVDLAEGQTIEFTGDTAGIATAAKQDTGNASLATVATNTGANSFANITTATTTTVKGAAGSLHAITVNSKGTVASTITIYDNTSGTGTKIGTIDSLNLSGTFTFDVSFATGLTLVTTGTVAPDVTVSYK